MGKRTAYRILVGNPEVKRPLGRPRRKRVDNIKMDLREIGWGGIDRTWLRIGTNEGALLNTVMNIRVPQNVGQFLSSLTIGGFSRRAQLLLSYYYYTNGFVFQKRKTC
jgi:hypothetical protein